MSLQCSAYFCIEMQSFAVICKKEDCLLSFVGDEEVRMVEQLDQRARHPVPDDGEQGSGRKKVASTGGGVKATADVTSSNPENSRQTSVSRSLTRPLTPRLGAHPQRGRRLLL
jgi:hypothetical protein